jgi:hypothetical protein
LEPARIAGNRTLLSVLYHHIGNLQRTNATLAAIDAFKSSLELHPLGRQSRQVDFLGWPFRLKGFTFHYLWTGSAEIA